MSRTIPAIASLLALLLLTPAPVAQRRDPPRTPADSLAARVEPLFVAAQYDSILAIAALYVRRAEATDDSLLLGRAVAQRGRISLLRGARADAERDIDFCIRVAESVRDTTGLMSAVHFKGFVYRSQGNRDAAMACFQRRLALALAAHAPVDEGWARSSMGLEYHLRGDQSQARDNFTRSIELARASDVRSLEITSLIGLGRVLSAIGEETDAVRCYQRAWVVAREIGDKVNEMWATNNLGVLEETRGDLSRASQYQQRAYELARELKQPYAIVVPATNLADRAAELGDYETAEAILREMREMCSTQGAETYLPMIDFRLAELQLDQGRSRAAGASLRRLLAHPERLEPQHRDFAVLDMARILVRSDSTDAAVELISSRLDRADQPAFSDFTIYANMALSSIFLEVGDAGRALAHASAARENAQHAGRRRTVIGAMLRESVCLRALNRGAEAERTFHAALDSIEAFRGGISTAEWREVYGQGVSRGVVDAGRVLLSFPEASAQASRNGAFFDAMQRVKTRALLDRITEPRFGADEIEDRWSRRVATLADVQAVLQPGEALLDFFVGSQESHLAAVTADSLRVVTLPSPDSPLAERVRLFRTLLASEDPDLRGQYPAERMTALQRALGRDVLGAVGDIIESSTRVFTAPDDYFAAIPFGILITDDGDSPLMARCDIVQVPSASVLVLQRSIRRSECVSNPNLVAIASGEPRLAGARDEVRALARRYGDVEEVTNLAGAESFQQATQGCDVLHVAAHALVVDRSPWESGIRLASGPAGAIGVPHDEMRAAAASTDILPAADSLLVARTFQADPYVRAWQIAQLSLPAKLAVLSACETAGGRVTSGEGTLGITAAFLSAGVPVVVSSLWAIDDRVTTDIMRAFYRYLSRGEPVATALRHAQLDLARSRRTAHPFFWAGFTVVGDGSMVVEIEERRGRNPPALLAGSAVMVLAALGWAIRRRRTPASVG
ncbi:MAG TPA: CHAT domain-containing protein [Candidatus Krumholzibacteria bacterium]|nr:CHAT domain-containing protein [Candidatus Krumholzibacteria bacterium]